MRIMPIQKLGIESSASTPPTVRRSAAVPRRHAAQAASVTPSSTAPTVLRPTSASVHGTRSSRTSATGRLYSTDSPRSPCAVPTQTARYCSRIDWFSP